jgi:hypothetical protein
MRKGSLFLALAAWLLAGLMLGTPSQAGSVVTTDASFSVSPSSGKAADLEVTYTATPTAPITILAGTTVTGVSETINGNKVTIDFTPVNSGVINFSFATAALPPVTFTEASLTGVTTGAKGTLVIAVSAIPEPASMALLGIGISGLFVLRRYFKRPSVA